MSDEFNRRMRSVGQRHQKPRGTVPLKGVCLHRPSGKYLARLCVLGERRHLGYYATAEEAARAYDRAYYAEHGGGRGNYPITDYPLSVLRRAEADRAGWTASGIHRDMEVRR